LTSPEGVERERCKKQNDPPFLSKACGDRTVSGVEVSVVNVAGFANSLWRGFVGGLVGGLLYVLTHPTIVLMVVRGKLLIALTFLLPIAGIVGTAIGGLIWWRYSRTGRNTGAPARALIGAAFAGLLAGLLSIFGASDQYPGSAETGSFINSKAVQWIFLMTFLGAVPGIIVGRQDRTTTVALTQSRMGAEDSDQDA
jgi:hypothetical protein